MSTFVGKIGDKISVKVRLVKRFEQTSYKFSYYGTTTYTYIMRDEADNVLVWRTSNLLDFPIKNGEEIDFIHVGDWLVISGTVKEHAEYKGEAQTVLSRCKYSLVERAPDPTITKQEGQKASLADGDFIWEMPYKQYKEHYADCETLAGSFNDEKRTIKVIIRHGRLKPSGVRGKHYSSYGFSNGKCYPVFYYAINEDNAWKRFIKDFPEREDWVCVKII